MEHFIDAKTFMQTSRAYEAGIDIPVDAVVVHPHNVVRCNANEMHNSWKNRKSLIGRMFFANSDDLNEYWKGSWDAIDHSQDIETGKDGERIFCAEIRPYMLPTDNWITFLKDKKVLPSLENGIDAILPEEPLAHTFSGYEASFQKLYQQFYGVSWDSEKSSSFGFYRTSYLKAALYNKLETELMEFTKTYARENKREIAFVVPVHSIFSNKATEIVAPLGLLREIQGYDGYIGQVWTGPVNWCLSQYDSPEKSFFCSALMLYDYFVQLTIGTDKKLWLEVDPVEDDPHHSWDEFRGWYQDCVTAMLLMKDINTYEVLPWPERIFKANSFTPGVEDPASEEAPGDYLKVILSTTQLLQDIPKSGQWLGDCGDSHIGIAIADSTMWQKSPGLPLQGLFGLRMPLLQRGIYASNFIMERACEKDYINYFKTIVLSFEDFKPYKEEMINSLADWVAAGGNLMILSNECDELDREVSFWWQQKGFASPLEATLAALGYQAEQNQWCHKKGRVVYNSRTPKEFADPSLADEYICALQNLSENAEPINHQPGYFAIMRGSYLIAHAETQPFSTHGHFVDIFDPDLKVTRKIKLEQGQSGVFKDISNMISNGGGPKTLHTTFRLIYEDFRDGILKFVIKGPAETELVARIYKGRAKVINISATTNHVPKGLSWIDDSHNTFKLTCPNDPDGVLVKVMFS